MVVNQLYLEEKEDSFIIVGSSFATQTMCLLKSGSYLPTEMFTFQRDGSQVLKKDISGSQN